jgi:seryl-tRNA synthetase
MLDIQLFRDEPETIKENERRRGKDPGRVDTVRELDERWRETRQKLDELRHEQNSVSDEIAEKKRNDEDAQDQIERMQQVKEQIADLEEQEQELLEERDEIRYKIGNIMHEDVPDGEDEDENVELRTWEPKEGKKDDAVLGADIMENYELIETATAANVAGERAYYLKPQLLDLNMALIRFGLDLLQDRGYTTMQTPYYLNKEQMEAAAELEDFHEQLFKLDREDRYLIATSEQTLAAFHYDEIFQPDELPKRYGGYSTNFRREAGKHGKQTRGIWRVHQFEKVEQFIFCKPENSWELHDELLQNAEDVMQQLNLPYRVVNVCTGDLGDTPAKKYDIEVWRPPLGEYGEVVSCSNCTDYQARKLQARMRGEDDNPTVHTLNATAVATSRIITAIIENNQLDDGRIKIPEALHDYMGGQAYIEPAESA